MYSLVVIRINGFYHGQALHHGSINECELSLAIYVQGKNILRKSCVHENILTLIFIIHEIFSVK